MKEEYSYKKIKKPWEEFESRLRSPSQLRPFLPFETLDDGTFSRALESQPEKDKRCIYIHVPFCKQTCNFCGYYKCTNSHPDTIEEFCQTLLLQIHWLAGKAWVKEGPFKAVYFGGGTPTALPAKSMREIIESLKREFPLSENCEISVESSFRELDPSYLDLFSLRLVNRLSLGVQSFNESIRKKYSRISGPDEMEETILSVADAGIGNLCIDLLYNLEGQNRESWEKDLARVAQLGIQGCSVYPLLPQPDAPLVKNKLYRPPEPQEEYARFAEAEHVLMEIPGWECFTPVQYGHYQKGRAEYVIAQAHQADILALGPGAGGRIGGIQYLNAFSLDEFAASRDFFHPKRRLYGLNPTFEGLEEKSALFRTGFMQSGVFRKLFYNNPFADFLSDHSYVTDDGNWIKLTQKGRYWAVNLYAELLRTKSV